MSASKSVTFRGEVFAPSRSSYASLIFPFAVCKKFLQTLFRLSLKLLWSELVKGKTADPLLSGVAFLAFCTLSLIAFYGRAYTGFLILIFCLLWFVDCQLARHAIFSRKHRLATAVECRGGWVLWQRQTLDGKTKYIKFLATQVSQISLVRSSVRGGAFQEVVGTVWQVYLTLSDRSEWLIDETWETTLAFEQANRLSQHFAVPVVVLASEGEGRYAAEPLNLPDVTRTEPCSTICCQKSGRQWHIYSRWQASSTWELGRQIWQRFGFLLFAVIVANLMIPFGALLHIVGSIWFQRSIMGLDFTVFNFGFRWQAILELAFALGIMVYKGAQISREEHLYITPDRLTFFLNTQEIAQVKTTAIDAVLFLKQPLPSLLILTQDQAIEIRELQQVSEFRAMLLQLNEALAGVQTST